jgi:hypothetical protein
MNDRGMNNGKVRVLMPGRLEHVVECPLHVFPQRIAPRLDHHAAAHGRVLGEIRRPDDLLVPLGVVVVASGRYGGARLVHL